MTTQVIDGRQMECVGTYPKPTAHLTALSLRRKSYLARVVNAVNGFEVWKSVEIVKKEARTA